MNNSESTAEGFKWEAQATVHKWDRSEDYDAGLPFNEELDAGNNILLNAGITRLLNLLTGAGGTAFNATNSRIGVGDSTTAAVASQTDLQAVTNKWYQLVTGAPGVSAQTVTFIAAFGTADGNFAWQEWGIDNGLSSTAVATAPMLNRKVVSMGTKSSGSTWTLTVTITIS